MTYLWTASDVQKATQGKLVGPDQWQATLPSIDTRTLTAGEFYIAIKGHTLDGHAYIKQAFEKGAVAALVDHIPTEFQSSSHSFILVKDANQALLDLGKYARDRFQGKVIGVTGSAGKTSTKDLLKYCLDTKIFTAASVKSFNNQWGVPLTIAKTDPTASYLILEMGMSAGGELSLLSKIARPHIAIITTIAEAHLEFFESIKHIAYAKGEIFQTTSPFSESQSLNTVFINGDISQSLLLQNLAREEKIKNIYTFGQKADCDLKLLQYTPTATGCRIESEIMGEEFIYELSLFGIHHASNSLSVLGTLKVLGYNLNDFVNSLKSFQPSDRRGHILHLKNNITLIDESYNANPASVKASLIAFAERPTTGRKIIVLADMLELGSREIEFHEDLKNTVLEGHFDEVYCIGPLMKHLYNKINHKIPTMHTLQVNEMTDKIKSILQPQDFIFFKGSNGMKLSNLIQNLITIMGTKPNAL